MKSVLCMLGWWVYEECSLHVGLVGAFFACWVGGRVLCMLGWWARSLHVGLVGAFFACWVGGRVLCMLGWWARSLHVGSDCDSEVEK